ncbi:MAG: type II toxin-antitoxin system PemK/MazF family toxin [Gammaproteobacteria bacterium]|nr:type II toxin-antitoxin system PemK/MazF family toxin [Gammaproteobacteria bacterium]
MERGDIWLVDLNPAAGHEQRGVRPVVIVSPDSFNQLTGTPVVVPVTRRGNFARRRGFTVSLEGAGTQTTGVIRCDQPRTVDFAARRGRRIESIPQTVMDDVLARLRAIIA